MRCSPLLIRAFMLLLVTTSVFASKAKIEVTDLRCEYLVDPLGLDTAAPRLGWRLECDRKLSDARQESYRIMVATSAPLLQEEKADLWDSGWVASDQSQQIQYAGGVLKSSQACWWKVRVKTSSGVLSGWSKTGKWTMGVLQPADWTANWVGTEMSFARTPENSLPDPILRKKFGLVSAPQSAFIHVGSVGYHEVVVNGKPVSDAVLSPSVTDNSKRARYVTYDITRFLNAGDNVIGIALGFSWSVFPSFKTADKPQSPIVIAQAEIQYSGGQTVRVVTDETWRWTEGPTILHGYWDFMHFGGERYDAGKETARWAEATLEDRDWRAVKVYKPALVLSAEQVEPNRKSREILPAAIKQAGTNSWRVDMGVNYSGWVEVKVSGHPGDKIEFRWSEREERDMTHEHRSFYIVGPTGEGTFCNRFNYQCGRWITISGMRQEPKLKDIRGWLIRTDYQRAGEFECSNELLNRIYRTTAWTYENLTLGGYVVDCAQRERMGYGGDAHATTATGMDLFKTAALYTKWAEDWRDVQGKNPNEPGNLPYTAPTYWGGGGPGWSGYCVTLPWEMYSRFGDRRILDQMFPTIEKWLAFLETRSATNLLRRWGGEWDFLGDWLWPGAQGVNGDTRETLFFNNCYWVYNLQTAARIAKALGREERAAAWEARATILRNVIHREFFNQADNSYVNGFQAYLAIALLTEIPPEQVKPRVAERLEREIREVRKGHFWAGITGGSFVIKQLIETRRPDLLYLMAAKEDFPGWGHMLKQGATTMWEDWEGKLSLSHSSYLHIGAWFMEGLGGIRPGAEGSGYKNFVVQPGVWESCPLEWVKSSFDSPYGLIRSDWTRREGATTYRLVVPANTTGTAILYAGLRQADQRGKALKQNKRGQRAAPTRGLCRGRAFARRIPVRG